MGEISEMIRRTLQFYPNIKQSDIRTIIIQSADRLLKELPEKLGLYAERILSQRGKLAVDRNLNVNGMRNVWALGDAALIPLDDSGENFAPPTAQFAVREAQCLARNISATLAGNAPQPFVFKPHGALASIGNYKGVAEIFGISFSGLIAWMTWRFLYIGMLPNFSTRLRIALNWTFDFVMPRSIVQITNASASSTIKRRYLKGDVVSTPGQLSNIN